MSHTIRNPVEWSAEQLKSASKHLESVGEALGGESAAQETQPRIKRVSIEDVREALRLGVEDFKACRTDVIFLAIVYPVAGVCLSWVALHHDFLPLLFPIISGFALVGPVAAVGLYEMSRRRYNGEEVNWASAFRVLGSPSFGAIFVLGLMLVGIFFVWLLTAQGIYNATLGPEPPASHSDFLRDVLTTPAGWELIVIGVSVGFGFAVVVLAVSVISFPLLLEHKAGIPVAVWTSVRAVMMNPVTFAVWGVIVAGGLVLGSIPVFLGLIVIMPILGHATWHLYRRTVSVPPTY